MTLTGIDVSRHQGSINWPQVAAAGHSFAWCKATDGVAYKYIVYFAQQASQIRAAGLVLGAYHWLTERDDPAAQARYFVRTIIETLGSADGVLCAVDVERGANGETPSAQQARVFAMEFHRLTNGHPLLVYTGAWYWSGVLKNPHGADIGPLWHSEYDTGAEFLDGPELDHYGGWTHCLFWQHTSSGIVPGVAGRCDRNLFYGDQAALRALAGAPSAPVPEEDEDMTSRFILAHPAGPHFYIDGPLVVYLENGQTRIDFQDAKAAPFVTVAHVADADAILNAHRLYWPPVSPPLPPDVAALVSAADASD